MTPHEEHVTEISDRRRHNRRVSQSNVRLTVEAREIQGQAENVSRSGLLFFSQGDLRVSVQIEENGATTTRNGRLIRAQRMRGESFGWAVEFDP